MGISILSKTPNMNSSHSNGHEDTIPSSVAARWLGYLVPAASKVANCGAMMFTLKNKSTNKKYTIKITGILPEDGSSLTMDCVNGSEEDITVNNNSILGTLAPTTEYEIELECSGNLPGTAQLQGVYSYQFSGYGKGSVVINFTT